MAMLVQASDVEPLKPKFITSEEADISCKLATLFHPLRRNEIARNFDVKRLLKPSALQAENTIFRVALAFGEERADLYLGRGLIERSIETLGISAATSDGLSRWELTSCLNLAWQPMLQSLTSDTGVDVTVLDAGLADGEAIPTANQGNWFGLAFEDRTFETCLILKTSKLPKTLLARLVNERLPPPTGVDTSLYLQIGGGLVPASMVQNLSVGDVVVLPQDALSKPRLILEVATSIPCQFQREIQPSVAQNGRIDLAQIWQGQTLVSLGVPIRDSQQNQTHEHGKASMTDNDPMNFDASNIEVDLRFVAGSIKMPINELGQIGPGYVFNLGTPVADQITLQVNGRPMAVGELVSIQGELGVRILRTFDSVQ
jgi:type III secretion system YscQ/HrcQ family protein